MPNQSLRQRPQAAWLISNVGQKMKFSHTYAAHSCFYCKKYSHTSEGSPNWSVPYLLLAVILTLPFWLFFTFSRHVPWYSGGGFFAGELLLFYGGGVIASVTSFLREKQPTVCPECGKPLLLAGRYFKDARKPNSDDLVIAAVFLVANGALWILIAAGRL
jgi:hypothetical protein